MDTAKLLAFAGTQRGVFTTAQAVAAGVGTSQISALCRSGRWRRLYAGAYVMAEFWEGLTITERHLCLVQARLLVLRPGWFAARRSAAVAHELPMLGALPEHPQLLRDNRERPGRSRSRHERVAPLPLGDRCGRVTSLARTVVDLAREESFRSAVVLADAALRRGLDPLELSEVATRCSPWRGGTSAMQAVAFADGRSESALESLSRVAFRDLGLPMPEPQVEIFLGERLVARVDFLWREQLLVGEADGRVKYTDMNQVFAEKVREESLEDLGLEVARWGWRAATSEQHVLEQKVRRGLARGRARVLDPRVSFRSSRISLAA